MILKPCVVFASGVACTGKSSTMKELSRKIDNAFYLDRDDINRGNLHVSLNECPELTSFEKYVANDGLFPDSVRSVVTPFGEMINLDPTDNSGSNSDFYRRHVRDQSYLVQTNIAKTNLDLGKVVLIDCIVARQIQDGTLRKLLEQDAFQGYPKHLVHFIADKEDCYQRVLERAKTDPYAARRLEVKRAVTRESFYKYVAEESPMIPSKLKEYEHLKINSSELNLEESVRRVIEYIS